MGLECPVGGGRASCRRRTSVENMDKRRVFAAVAAIVCAFTLPLSGQGKSGPRSVDACGLLTQAELEGALTKKVRPVKVPANVPASLGVSVCMWATPDGRRTFSVSSYGPEAVRHTQAQTIEAYYDSLKTSNANLTRTPAHVVQGAGRRASWFPSVSGQGNTILVLRSDCVVTVNATGLSPQEIAVIAKAIGAP